MAEAPGILVKARPARQRPRYAKVGVYGDPGAGKTWLSGTIEDIRELVKRSLFIDIEGGTMTIGERNIDVLRITSWAEIQQVYAELYQMHYTEGYEGEKYDACIIDSMTELQKLNMNDIMRMVKKEHPERDELVPSQREWGKSSEMMRRMIRAFRDLPMHVIFVFLAKEDRDDITGEVKIRPDLPGKLAAQVAGFLDIVGHLGVYVEEEKNPDGTLTGKKVTVRKLLVQPTQKYTAKDRSGKLGPGLRNPTMRDILGPVLQMKNEMPEDQLTDDETENENDGADILDSDDIVA